MSAPFCDKISRSDMTLESIEPSPVPSMRMYLASTVSAALRATPFSTSRISPFWSMIECSSGNWQRSLASFTRPLRM